MKKLRIGQYSVAFLLWIFEETKPCPEINSSWWFFGI
jgi:hypothetical protein